MKYASGRPKNPAIFPLFFKRIVFCVKGFSKVDIKETMSSDKFRPFKEAVFLAEVIL